MQIRVRFAKWSLREPKFIKKMEGINQFCRVISDWGKRRDKTACLYPVTFLVALASGMSSLGLIFFAKNVLGASPGQVGILSATWSVFYMCGCYLFRHLSATLPPRYSILTATFMSFCSIAMIFMVRSLFWSFIFFSIYGLALALFWPVVMGWLSSGLEGGQFGRVMGWFNFSWSTGSIISPVIAGWLEDTGNSFALRGGSCVFLAAACLVAFGVFMMPSLGHKVDVPPRSLELKKHAETGTFLRYPAWFSIFASFFLIGTILTVVSLAAGTDLDMTKKTVGILFFARALIMSLTLIVMGQISWWHFRGKQIAVGALIGVVAAVLLAYTRSPIMMGFVMVIVGVITAQSYTNSLFHGVSGVPDKTWRMAIHEMILNAGFILGSVSGGVAYGASGITLAYLISAIILMINVFVVGIILNVMRKRESFQGALS